jgi:hypothetical protein
MRRILFLAFLVQIATASMAYAAGPYGNIHVGNWKGGAFTDDHTGAFSHCGATSIFDNGVILVVGLNATKTWLLGFASPGFHLTKGNTVPVDVTFDDQSQARLFATANSDIMATAILPLNVARAFQKSSLMVVTTGNSSALQFNLTSTAPLLAVLANCVNIVEAGRVGSTAPANSPHQDPPRRRPTHPTIPNRPGPAPRPAPDSLSARTAISSPTTT